MRRWTAFLLVTALAVALAALLARAPEALARVEAFRVEEVRLEGARFLTPEEAARVLAVGPGASVWDDLGVWEDRIRGHPLVREARVSRRLPGTVVVRVVEREPVALVAVPILEPVDEGGEILPVDPALHRLDLPLLARGGAGQGVPGSLTPLERRLLAGEIARLGREDPELLAWISELVLEGRGELRARTWDPPLTLYLLPGLPPERIREGLRVLGDAQLRFEGAQVASLDLRYEDQVVVRLRRPGRS